MGAVRQEHGHGRAGVCLGEADAGAGGKLSSGAACMLAPAAKALRTPNPVASPKSALVKPAVRREPPEPPALPPKRPAEQVVNVDACAAVAEAAEVHVLRRGSR